jgi:hypothetical protein
MAIDVGVEHDALVVTLAVEDMRAAQEVPSRAKEFIVMVRL